jgi:hypothetical protein
VCVWLETVVQHFAAENLRSFSSPSSSRSSSFEYVSPEALEQKPYSFGRKKEQKNLRVLTLEEPDLA